MAKFYGLVGYVIPCETAPGVWTDKATEKVYRGDILQSMNRWQPSGNVNDNINVDNKISILSDPFAYENFSYIRYIKWMGAYWKVNNVEIIRPRLLISIGEVYNGPTVEPPQ